MKLEEIIALLESKANPENVAGMARYGIRPKRVYGVPMKELSGIAKRIGKDHEMAQRLWAQGSHEARLLAADVEDPKLVTEDQAEAWVRDIDSWAQCDSLCIHLLWKTPFAYEKAIAWSAREEEFVKRAGFALMAKLAWSDKRISDECVEEFLLAVRREAGDDRPMVRKAVNWALRQIGKRSPMMNARAIATARAILDDGTPSGRWIARDALRELESDVVKRRLGMV